MDSLAKETAPLRVKVETAEEALAPLQAAADELQSKLTLEQQEFDLIMAGQRREQDRADKANQGVAEARSKLKEREAQLKEAQLRLSHSAHPGSPGESRSIHVGLQSATRDLADVKVQETTLTEELHKMRVKLAESRSKMQVAFALPPPISYNLHSISIFSG